MDMVFHVCPLEENLPALPLVHCHLRSYRCVAAKWALPWIFPLVGKIFIMLCSPELVQRGHDKDVSITSEDYGYPEAMDQDKQHQW